MLKKLAPLVIPVLLMLALSAPAMAQEITKNCPDRVVVGQEFTCQIRVVTGDTAQSYEPGDAIVTDQWRYFGSGTVLAAPNVGFPQILGLDMIIRSDSFVLFATAPLTLSGGGGFTLVEGQTTYTVDAPGRFVNTVTTRTDSTTEQVIVIPDRR